MSYSNKNQNEIKVTCSVDDVVEILYNHYLKNISDDYVALSEPYVRVISIHKLMYFGPLGGWYSASIVITQHEDYVAVHIYRPIRTHDCDILGRLSNEIHCNRCEPTVTFYDLGETKRLLKELFHGLKQYLIV